MFKSFAAKAAPAPAPVPAPAIKPDTKTLIKQNVRNLPLVSIALAGLVSVGLFSLFTTKTSVK